ncbi:MAG: hypothetical protein IPL06_06305 [Betaproteobacteria bacterium]|nr:hypothetical protein [Betaproteobacteria bacterium]
MIQEQLAELASYCAKNGLQAPVPTALPSGGTLIRLPAVPVVGWNRPTADVLFLVPPGYPAARPDCFWVEPQNFRLANGQTPQNANDGNPIPSDIEPGRGTTWFSWHVESWDPSRSSLVTYFNVILGRLSPAR